MKKPYPLILVIIIFFALSQVSNPEDSGIAVPLNPSPKLSHSEGNFCSLGNVCVLTQSLEDCLKLGGENVKSCQQRAKPSTTAEHSDRDDCCATNGDSTEPVSCYGF